MLARATLCLVLLQATPVESNACDACTPGQVCSPHLEIERRSLPGLKARYASLLPGDELRVRLAPPEFLEKLGDAERLKEEAQRAAQRIEELSAERLDVLRHIAALNRTRSNALSAEVTRALCVGLRDEALTVRLETVALLREGQHAETSSEEMTGTLRALKDAYGLVGHAFDRRWKDVSETDPVATDLATLIESLDVRLAWEEQLHGVQGTVEKLGEMLDRIPEAKSRELTRNRRTLDKAGKERQELYERLVALHRDLNAMRDAFALEPVLVAALAAHPDERGRRALGQHFKQLERFCPTRSIPTARALLAIGVRSDVADVIDALKPDVRPPEERIGAADVSLSSHEDRRRTLHDALTQHARGLELEAPTWSDDIDDAWEEWFERNEERLPRKLD